MLGWLALGSSLVAVAGGATVSDVLPDLRMAGPTQFRVTSLHSGRRLLRFTTRIVNAAGAVRGPGVATLDGDPAHDRPPAHPTDGWHMAVDRDQGRHPLRR